MAEKTSIGIVGTGWVGSSVAISTLHNTAAQEVLLHDLNGAGAGEVIAPALDDTERVALAHSAEVLQKAIASVVPEQ